MVKHSHTLWHETTLLRIYPKEHAPGVLYKNIYSNLVTAISKQKLETTKMPRHREMYKLIIEYYATVKMNEL